MGNCASEADDQTQDEKYKEGSLDKSKLAEFKAAAESDKPGMHEDQKAKVAKIFKTLDINEDKGLDGAECSNYATFASGASLMLAECFGTEAGLKELDTDGNKTVSLEEF